MRFNINNKIIFIIYLLLLLNEKKACAQYLLRGKVMDKDKQPLEFATVVLQKDPVIIKTVFSDSLGNYEMKSLAVGSYRLILSYINCETKKITFTLKQDTLINAQLKSLVSELNEVVVTDQKPVIERKPDRLVFNIQNSIGATGGDALDALKKTPGIQVDQKSLSLAGKSSVNVLIDDRLVQLSGDELMNLLRSMSADDIERIEVITNPPAKYDAGGNGGLINIVKKKNKTKGYNATVRTGYKQTTYEWVFGNGTFNYTKGKWLLHTGLNASDGSTGATERRRVIYSDWEWRDTSMRRDFYKQIAWESNVDFQATPRMLLSLSYQGGVYRSAHPTVDRIYFFRPLTQMSDSLIEGHSYDLSPGYRHGGSVYLKHRFDTTGKMITWSSDIYVTEGRSEDGLDMQTYGRWGEKLPTNNRFLSRGYDQIRIYTSSVDVDLPYSWGTISCGGKWSLIDNAYDFNFYRNINALYQRDTMQSNFFTYREHTQALYLSASRTWKKWDWQMGLRVEYTQTRGVSHTLNQLVPNRYMRLFPTAYMTYRLNPNHVLSINYGRRIDRPAYYRLNPFRSYSTLYSYGEGNPFLQPSFSDNMELCYTYKSLLTSCIDVNLETNGYDQVLWPETNSLAQVFKQLNLFTIWSYGWYADISLHPRSWLETIANVGVYYNRVTSSVPGIRPLVEGWTTYFTITNQVVLTKNKNLMAELSINVMPSNVYSNSRLLRPIYRIDAGVRWMCYHERLQLAIQGDDIFKTYWPLFSAMVNGIESQVNNYYDVRMLRVSVQYRFGKDFKSNQRKSSNSDERQRSN